MISNYLSSINGIEIFPIISLVVFFSVFVGLVIWVIRLDKKYIEEMESLPLEKNEKLKTKFESKNAKGE